MVYFGIFEKLFCIYAEIYLHNANYYCYDKVKTTTFATENKTTVVTTIKKE